MNSNKLNKLITMGLIATTLCVVSPSKAESPECASSICITGSSPKPFKNNKLKLKKIFGAAPVVSSGDEDLAYFCYKTAKNEIVVLSYNSYEDGIWSIGVSSHYKCRGETVKSAVAYKLATEKGIKLGDSKEKVINKYGQPALKHTSPKEILRYISYDDDLSAEIIPSELWLYSTNIAEPRAGFAFSNNVVVDIFIDAKP